MCRTTPLSMTASRSGAKSPGSAIGGGYNNLIQGQLLTFTMAVFSNNAILWRYLFRDRLARVILGGGYDNYISFDSPSSTIGGVLATPFLPRRHGRAVGTTWRTQLRHRAAVSTTPPAPNTVTVGGGFSNNASSQGPRPSAAAARGLPVARGAFVGGGGYDGNPTTPRATWPAVAGPWWRVAYTTLPAAPSRPWVAATTTQRL